MAWGEDRRILTRPRGLEGLSSAWPPFSMSDANAAALACLFLAVPFSLGRHPVAAASGLIWRGRRTHTPSLPSRSASNLIEAHVCSR